MKRFFVSPWLPALLALIFRLLYLQHITFISPDGATYLRYELLVFTQRLPFYPMLAHTVSPIIVTTPVVPL